MKKVINLESLAIACYCLQKTIDNAIQNPPPVEDALKTTLALMKDYNDLMSAVLEIHDGGYDKFVILPVSDAQAEEYTDSDSIGMN